MKQAIKNATIINEDVSFVGSVITDGERISTIIEGNELPESLPVDSVIDATGLWLMPGVIDDQVHFREPGLTHKADIASESRAAVAGGVTSYMEMPNTMPLTTTIETLESKYLLGAEKSLANFSFYMGATNQNLDELKKVNPREVCGVKVFMGSSTGNMLVDDKKALHRIFAEIPMLIATHCEDEAIIERNKAYYIQKFGTELPINYHALIRDEEACYASSSFAVELATKYNTRLHVLHLSTAREMSLFRNDIPLSKKRITAEACVHHLWFCDENYAVLDNRIKWNPAIKSKSDQEALIRAVNENRIDVVATDHAPHLWEEKEGSCLKAASGGPLVQHALVAMLEMARQKFFTKEQVVRKMCHAPADLFRMHQRGYIRPGYYADMVLVDPNHSWMVSKDNILSKCAWSPFETTTFNHAVVKTWVNGHLVYSEGKINETNKGKRLEFDEN